MRVVWGRTARRDLNELISYLLEESIQAAELVGNRIRDAANRLGQNPRMGRPGRIAGTRELFIQKTAYIIAYRVRSRKVEIVGVIHGARRWPSRFD